MSEMIESHDSEELRGETTMGITEEQAEQETEILNALDIVASGQKTGDDATPHLKTAADLTIGLKDEYGADVAELLEGIIDALTADESEQAGAAYIAKRHFEEYREQRPSEPEDYVFVEFTDEKYAVNKSNVWDEYEIDENTGWVTLRYGESVVELPPQRIMEIQSAGHEDWVTDYFM